MLAGSRLSEGLDCIVPEDLAHQVRLHFWPAQRRVDGRREAALGVWVVRAEHQEVIAEVFRNQLDHLAALMEEDRGKEASAYSVLQHSVLQAFGHEAHVVRLVLHGGGPEWAPAKARFQRHDVEVGIAIKQHRAKEPAQRLHRAPGVGGGAAEEGIAPEITVARVSL